MRRFPRPLLPMILILAIAGLGAIPPAAAQTPTLLVFSAGPTGGSWTPMAAATAQLVNKRFPELNVQVEPGAALVNMEKLRNDKADLGWSMTTVLSDARAGTGVWKDKKTDKPLFVANYYPNVWQLAVTQASDVRKFSDLRGKPVALPPRGNASLAEGWELLLRLHGMKLEDLGTRSHGSHTDNIEQIKNRQAVAMGWFTTVPANFMVDLATSMKMRLVPIPDDVIEKMRQVNPGFIRHVIPKAAYAHQGVEEDVVTVQSPTILIAHARIPADTVYKITKTIVEGRAEFAAVTASMKGVTAADLAQNHGMPWHPGAERYFREAGILK